MRRTRAIATAIAVLAMASPAAAQRTVTYARDVAPLLRARCVACHRAGGDAPFSLETLEQARRHAKTIRAVTASRYMPPWKPQPGYGEFHGDRRLTDKEIATFADWLASGMPAGDSAAAVEPSRSSDWPLGEPDAVLRLDEFVLQADGPDVFRNFVVAMPPTAKGFVRAWHFRPGTTAVHHANIRIDPTPASRRLDEADPLAGYEGVILRSADFPDGHFLGWTPGQVPSRSSDHAAWPIRPGDDFVVQLHMRPTGKRERIAPVIGLYLGTTAPSAPPSMIRLGRQDLAIPEHAPRHHVVDSFELPVAVAVHAIQAHGHYRARRVQAWADLPDGTRRELLRIEDWDPAWQDRYTYRSPVALPAGTRLSAEYVFDNSAGNVRNPVQPPQRAGWGWRTADEMGDVWLQVATTSDAARATLRLSAQRHMLAHDAIGTELLIAREPRRADLRNDAGAIYMSLRRHTAALHHFREAQRLQPSAVAAFNVGVALEAVGQLSAAEREYAEAVSRDPAYSSAHNNLGTLLLRRGEPARAHTAFSRAVAANPDNAEAHANFAVTSIARGDVDAAETHVTSALRLRPERAPQYAQFVWLLRQSTAAAGRGPAAACRLARAIVAAAPDQDAGLRAFATTCQ